MKLKVIAGAGSEPRMNFGDFRNVSVSEAKKWKENLEKLIGKQVYLTGGGGITIHEGRLDGVSETEGPLGKIWIKANLSELSPPVTHGTDKFEPWIGSWQICIEEGPDCKGCKNECDSPNASLKDTMRRAEACRICVEAGQRAKEVVQ